jgi:hypothetical protein
MLRGDVLMVETRSYYLLEYHGNQSFEDGVEITADTLCESYLVTAGSVQHNIRVMTQPFTQTFRSGVINPRPDESFSVVRKHFSVKFFKTSKSP